MTTAPKLRWYQYSLRSLFLVMILACIGMSWFGVKIREARRQKEAVEAIKKLGGAIAYDYQVDASGHELQGAKPPGPAWIRSLLGEDFFGQVIHVAFDYSNVNDDELEHLKGLTRLRWISLSRTHVTDAGLDHLKGLVQLQWLWLENTQVTDAGLERLKGLTKLRILDLTDTQVSDQGVKKLQNALPNCEIRTQPPEV
jgi:hypothetical protein